MRFFRVLWNWATRRRAATFSADPAPAVARVALSAVAPLGRNRPPAEEASDFPAFRATAIDRLAQQGSTQSDARQALNEAFTPAQPVTDRTRFAGRLELLVRLISALEDQRAHVVLYGERGIGKTSLLHVLAGIARQSRYQVAYASCGAGSRFDEIFRGLLRDVPMIYAASVDPAALDAKSGGTLADLLPEATFDARQLGDVCALVTGTRVLLILDEYDRTEDAGFRRHVAELIKNLSDRAARVQIVIAGVAGNLQELVGYIPSIRRNILGLPVPRLERGEIEALIAIGEREAGMRFAPEATEMVDRLCHGSPYLARLMCHHAGLRALNADRRDVSPDDIRAGLSEIVREAENRLGPAARAQIPQLMVAGQEPLLGAIALAAATPDGSFGLGDVLASLASPLPEKAIASELARLEGLALITGAAGEGGPRFRFRDDTLPFYIWMAVCAARTSDGPDKSRRRVAA
ncbi:MAG: ATP-binding protein [Chakrabartia sp.]